MIALKYNIFNSARELAAFCADAGNSVTAIVSITFDAVSGKHTLFYT